MEYLWDYVKMNFDILVILMVDYSIGGLIIGVNGDYCWSFEYFKFMLVLVMIIVLEMVNEENFGEFVV